MIRGTPGAGLFAGENLEPLWSELVSLAGHASRMRLPIYVDYIAHNIGKINKR
jgi:hypothetical protein